MLTGEVSRTAFTSDRKTSASLLWRQSFVLDKSWGAVHERKRKTSCTCEFCLYISTEPQT